MKVFRGGATGSLLLGLVFVAACASPFNRPKKKMLPRSLLGMRLGMTAQELREEVRAIGESKELWAIDRPNVDVKRLEAKMGPEGNYLMRIRAVYFPRERLEAKDFAAEHLAFLGERRRVDERKNDAVGTRTSVWFWEDGKTSWELIRTVYLENPGRSEFEILVRDRAFEDILLNTGVGNKRHNQRELLRTGEF